MTPTTRPRLLTEVTATAAGCVAMSSALVIIWFARGAVDRPVYVSELGADGEPTAGWFRTALLLIASGSVLIARAGRGWRSAAFILSSWSISASITTAGALFFVASQVPCTAGCPLPAGENAVQDFTHTASAVLAFAFGAFAMLQAATVPGRPGLRALSLGCGTAVALVAMTGAVLSLLRFATDIGGLLEFVATTIGLGWVIVFGIVVSREGRHDPVAPRATAARDLDTATVD